MRHLLLRKRVFDAMLVGGMLLESTTVDTKISSNSLAPNTSALIYARRHNSGDEFVQAALCHGSRSQHNRLLLALFSFIKKWDPLYLKRCSSIQLLSKGLYGRVPRDDRALPTKTSPLPSSSAKKRFARRPSWAAMLIVEKKYGSQ